MDSCFGLVEAHQHSVAVRHKIELKELYALCPVNAEAGAKHPFKRQLHTTHMKAIGYSPKLNDQHPRIHITSQWVLLVISSYG